MISIHALRVEGDKGDANYYEYSPISIHALRVEGDSALLRRGWLLLNISIHALRVEGDVAPSHTGGGVG